jgi:hypothetical protein
MNRGPFGNAATGLMSTLAARIQAAEDAAARAMNKANSAASAAGTAGTDATAANTAAATANTAAATAKTAADNLASAVANGETIHGQINARIDGLATQLAGAVKEIRYRDNIPVPAVTTVLGSFNVDVTVTWDTPMPSTDYVIVTPMISTANALLIGKAVAAVKSKTAAGCVITITTTSVLAAGALTVSVLAFKK